MDNITFYSVIYEYTEGSTYINKIVLGFERLDDILKNNKAIIFNSNDDRIHTQGHEGYRKVNQSLTLQFDDEDNGIAKYRELDTLNSQTAHAISSKDAVHNKLLMNNVSLFIDGFLDSEYKNINHYLADKTVGKEEYKINLDLTKNVDEIIRQKLGGDYICVGSMDIDIKKENDHILLKEFDYNNEVNTDYNYIKIDNIEYIVKVLELKLIYDSDKDGDSVVVKGNDILYQLGTTVNSNISLFSFNDVILHNDIKNIKLSPKDIKNVLYSYKKLLRYKNIGGNKVKFEKSNFLNFTLIYMNIINILSKYNKNISSLYRKLINFGVGTDKFFNYNDMGGLYHTLPKYYDFHDNTNIENTKYDIMYAIALVTNNSTIMKIIEDIKNGSIYKLCFDGLSITIFTKTGDVDDEQEFGMGFLFPICNEVNVKIAMLDYKSAKQRNNI